MSQVLNEIDKNYSMKMNKQKKATKEIENKSNKNKENGTLENIEFNSKFSKLEKENIKESTPKKQNKFDLVNTLKSSLNSITKDDMEWILNQEIEIDNTIKMLSSEEISSLIDYLKTGLDSFRLKNRCLDWLESIVKMAANKISDKKLQELKCIIKPITLNHDLLLETISIFELIKDMSNINDIIEDKENYGKSNHYVDTKYNKHKIAVVYNESDSEEEMVNKEKANILKKIEEKKKEKMSLLKQKTKNKLIDSKEEDYLEEDDDDNSYDENMDLDEEEVDESDENDFEDDIDEEMN